MPEHSGRLGRPRSAAIIAFALVVAAAAALVLGGELSGTRAGAASASKASGTATVARRDLIQTDTESGTLSYADPQTVFNRLSGTITSLPAAGTVVKPGGVLFTVDNAPVVLMDGSLPAFRSLSDGVADGPDIRELEQNLVALGYDSGHAITVDDHFDAATTAAVDRWQAALGQTQTGIVTLGQVVFLPGSRRVSTVSAVLGSAGGGSGAGATGASLHAGAARPLFVDATSTPPAATPITTTTTTTTTTMTTSSSTSTRGQGGGQSTQTATLLALVAVLRAEVAELKAAKGGASLGSGGTRSAGTGSGGAVSGGGSGARAGSGGGGASTTAGTASGGSSGSASSGSGATGAATAQAVLSTTSTQLVATVPLDATKQSEAVVGERVTVQMPDGSTVSGRIAQVAAAAQAAASSSSGSAGGSGASSGSGSGSGSAASSTVPVTITLRGRRRAAGLDQAAVSVDFEQQKALGVLSVPVTALLATAGGGYAIQAAAAPHGLIPVTPGLFAAGYVQVSGTGISEGLAVTNSQG